METSVLGKLYLALRISGAVNAPEDELCLCADLTSLGNRNSEEYYPRGSKTTAHLFAVRDVSESGI
jgi:hypothetical protein